MSLRFCFGPSGAGKSYQMYREIIRRSMEEPGRNFLVVVPDQFTMQTQKELVTMHERGGIMNIDVLSFGRLSHRILEEVGGEAMQVLDDTGKSLVLQRVALAVKEKLPVLGSHLHRQGYIHEVKSAISEFMQYGLSVADVGQLAEYALSRGALYYKLKDLEYLYAGFLEYIQGHFITTEEKLDILRGVLKDSKIVRDSVIVFDGFTGFTPIQNRLIQELMLCAGEVVVTVTLGEREDPFKQDGEQKLFYLSKKTVYDLEKLAEKAGVPRGKDIYVGAEGSPRFGENQALRHLERNLFRSGSRAYAEAQEQICLFEAPTPKEEVHQAGLEIARLIREKHLQYRDVAVIVGDMDAYAAYVEREFADMQIPCYIDRTRGIVLNPMIEYIKSALDLFLKDFSYEAVFHYLRSGMADFSAEETDILENYILQTGIRGKRRWERLFTHKTPDMDGKEEPLQKMNELRERLVSQVAVLDGKRITAKEHIDALYEFLVQTEVQKKLQRMEHAFTEQGELTRSREYAQIYGLVMNLLDQIYALLEEEEISGQEFLEILEAGFGEIEVGTIPQNVDRILVGDMERSRLKQVKVLFFMGVNDGNIPRNSSKGGILSDMDREFLKESDWELAPSPRQQMFIQRFYLYLNLTKPSEKLYISYAKVGSDGKTLRPSYLVDTVRKLFPGIEVCQPWKLPVTGQIVTAREGSRYLAEGLREYVEGGVGKLKDSELYALYSAYEGKEEYKELARILKEAAFYRYQAGALSKEVARALYGKRLEISVQRLEKYAACAYGYFLRYGLSLQEREQFGFEAVDMGNIFHEVLDIFAEKLENSEYTWFDFPAQFGEAAVAESMEQLATEYGAGILYSCARQEYGITRMRRILTRTVSTLQEQLNKGDFVPKVHEMSFQFVKDIEAIDIRLSQEESMRLQGRIDRVDIAEDENQVFVKVIDYKSGEKQFDLAALYYGLQLQLVVYMNAAMEIEAKRHPDKEIVPAALLYYHVADPVVDASEGMSPEEVNDLLRKELRMNGVVNSRDDIISKLDKVMGSKSDVIPVERKKDGSLGARSGVMSSEELQLISSYVSHKVRSIGREILDGHKEVNPYAEDKREACDYCAYKRVCGFDQGLPGYEKRKLEALEKEEVFEKMKEVLQ